MFSATGPKLGGGESFCLILLKNPTASNTKEHSTPVKGSVEPVQASFGLGASIIIRKLNIQI
jgi:hypothetical protein